MDQKHPNSVLFWCGTLKTLFCFFYKWGNFIKRNKTVKWWWYDERFIQKNKINSWGKWTNAEVYYFIIYSFLRPSSFPFSRSGGKSSKPRHEKIKNIETTFYWLHLPPPPPILLTPYNPPKLNSILSQQSTPPPSVFFTHSWVCFQSHGKKKFFFSVLRVYTFLYKKTF